MSRNSFRIRNWRRFQDCKTNSPLWIKLHLEIFASQDWVSLKDRDRFLMVVCLLIASRDGGKVPSDPDYIKRVAYLDSTPDLEPLLKCGFLEMPVEDASAQPPTPENEEFSFYEPAPLHGAGADGRAKHIYSEEFLDVWDDYRQLAQNNSSKWAAFQKFKKLSPVDRLGCSLGLSYYVLWVQDERAAGALVFVKHLSTFINERGWEAFLEQIEEDRAKLYLIKGGKGDDNSQ